MLDDAVRLVVDLDEPPEQNYVRAPRARPTWPRTVTHRRATTRIFGSKPGSYGAGILPLIEAGNWRNDADLAEVYTAWGGFAYGRDLDGVPARDDMETNYRRITVAAKNIDTREHDIADSDDYFQYHGGMVATVRVADRRRTRRRTSATRTTPDAVRTRSLTEETARVFRARVVNPRWIAAMQRHGYKGAFELAATVDYLFGFDATAGVVTDWMYAPARRELRAGQAEPGLHEARQPLGAARRSSRSSARPPTVGCGPSRMPELMAELQQVYLDVEGDLEDAAG